MIKLHINNGDVNIRSAPDTPLLYVLRDELGMNGAKFGCGLGQCGACTVIVDGAPVPSCVAPIDGLVGMSIVTIEGLAAEGGKPNPIQQAFIDEQAAQCGYCTAGMVMRAESLLRANPVPTDAEMREQMSGSLCRCGSHMRVLRAIGRVRDSNRRARK